MKTTKLEPSQLTPGAPALKMSDRIFVCLCSLISVQYEVWTALVSDHVRCLELGNKLVYKVMHHDGFVQRYVACCNGTFCSAVVRLLLWLTE